MKYTKKPVEIDAEQLMPNTIKKVYEFIHGEGSVDLKFRSAQDAWENYESIVSKSGLKLKTLESDGETQIASIGDFIIKGVKGEFYPCKPDIFELTYTSGSDDLSKLTALQAELGYVKGEISTVAMLGLVGEAGEVLRETYTDSDNHKFHMQMIDTLANCKKTEEYKKSIRKGTVKIYLKVEEQNKHLFDAELADTFYYLNILATNRGLTINDLAQMAHDKVRAKQAAGGSSEDKK